MTTSGLVQTKVPPQGELGKAGAHSDILGDPEKVLSDFSLNGLLSFSLVCLFVPLICVFFSLEFFLNIEIVSLI